jgi:xanthine/uracil permease
MENLDKIMNDPIFMGIAVLLAILVVYSILKKLFKLFGIIILITIIYLVYLTQIEKLSYEEATNKAKSVGQDLIIKSQKKINKYKDDIIQNEIIK